MSSRTRHLIFLAHLWLCAPFLVYWLATPMVRWSIPEENFGKLRVFIGFILVYLVARTALAFKNPPWLKWELMFGPVDVAIVSVLIWLGDRDPINKTSLLYFFAVAEAAGTLSVWWAASVGGMVLLGAGLASDGFNSDDPFNTAFQYFFILVMASLLAALARASSKMREQLGVARDRSRIAMEMHDGVQGHLITIASQLELAQRLAESDPKKTARLAEESKDSARLAADELRYLVQRLRAPSLNEGFLPALKQFAHNQAVRNGLALEFVVEGEPFEVGPEMENALFRVAQEALTNVLRHGHAEEVRVEVAFHSDSVKLAVRDDGVGFEPGDQEASHAGLEGMQSRATALGGKVSVVSKPGAGTSVELLLPRLSRVKEVARV